jgi:hypothetical protein
MKAMEAINQADRLRPNAYSAEEKLRWLERIERRVEREILEGYGEADDAQGPLEPETELRAPSPYEELYLHFLCAQMSLGDGEIESFNSFSALFEALFSRFRNAWNRGHMPKTGGKRYF